MTNSIIRNGSEFPMLAREIQVIDSIYFDMQLSADGIEGLLKKEEYQFCHPVKPDGLSKKQKQDIATAEKVTGFGQSIGDAFEYLLVQYGRLPTQVEFADYCVEQAKDWWTVDITGIDWNSTVEMAVRNRQLRSYSSHLVELHSLLTLRELFPEWQIYCSDSIDLLMGVDLVVETEQKRLYIHVFKNSRSAFQAYQKKQKRGGTRNAAGKFVKYNRDFTGDKSLQFDWSQSQCSESTQFINGNPLFKKEYLQTQLIMFDRFKQFGEDLSEMGKLQYLEQFLQKLQEESRHV